MALDDLLNFEVERLAGKTIASATTEYTYGRVNALELAFTDGTSYVVRWWADHPDDGGLEEAWRNVG